VNQQTATAPPYRYHGLVSDVYRAVRRASRRVLYLGSEVHCWVCGGDFRTWVKDPVTGACPRCESGPRHRIAARYLEGLDAKRPLSGMKTLYFAPDPGLERLLRARTAAVTTTDLSAPHVDVKMDLTDLPVADRSYELIVISHVLEHVLDDAKAMRELFRVLAPGGIAVVQVPLEDTPKTDEDASVTDPRIRKERWGLEDHVRLYGWDLVDRLEAAGFRVETLRFAKGMSDEELRKYGLWNDVLFACHRPEEAN